VNSSTGGERARQGSKTGQVDHWYCFCEKRVAPVGVHWIRDKRACPAVVANVGGGFFQKKITVASFFIKIMLIARFKLL
jgi:hypothetical protein